MCSGFYSSCFNLFKYKQILPVMNYTLTGIFNLRRPKPKLNNVWDMDILSRYHDRLGQR